MVAAPVASDDGKTISLQTRGDYCLAIDDTSISINGTPAGIISITCDYDASENITSVLVKFAPRIPQNSIVNFYHSSVHGVIDETVVNNSIYDDSNGFVGSTLAFVNSRVPIIRKLYKFAECPATINDAVGSFKVLDFRPGHGTCQGFIRDVNSTIVNKNKDCPIFDDTCS